MRWLRRARAFLWGMREWKTDLTLHHTDEREAYAYDNGRYLMWFLRGRES